MRAQTAKYLARAGIFVMFCYLFAEPPSHTVLLLPLCMHRTVKKFQDIEKDTCRKMFGQGGMSKSSNSSGKSANSKGEDGDHISPAELAKIRSLYVERFRQVSVC